jgi:diguanylate cyclase (GGDEF)-like protein
VKKTQQKLRVKFILFSIVAFIIAFALIALYFVIFIEQERSFINTIDKYATLLLVLFGVLAVVVTVLMYSFYHFILIKPFGILMKNVQHIENREFSKLEELNSHDEFNKISQKINDLASSIESKEQKLQYFAEHDSLTGLYNRYHFNNILNEELVTLQENHSVALVFSDVDEFKTINDTLGHDVGDNLLIGISKRLDNLVGKSGHLSRIGGDEFMVILTNIESYNEIYSFAYKLHALFDDPFHIDNHYLQITISSGIVITDGEHCDVTALYKEADIALYKSKEYGKNRFTIYEERYSTEIQERNAIFEGLKRAIGDNFNDFYLLYQPKIAAKDAKTIKGVESLIRWESKRLGFLPPDKFIAIAEESGLIIELGYWIIERSCRDFLQMQQMGLNIEQVSINISSNQFACKSFLNRLQEIIEQINIDPKCIEFELTERILAENDTQMLDTLHALQNAGIHIAIDDFGTGYSSLSYLQKLPVNRLKIDKSFVTNIDQGGAFNIVKNAIVPLAKTLNLHTTAEGVETKGEYHALKLMGVDDIQGYYFAKPMRLEELIEFGQK